MKVIIIAAVVTLLVFAVAIATASDVHNFDELDLSLSAGQSATYNFAWVPYGSYNGNPYYYTENFEFEQCIGSTLVKVTAIGNSDTLTTQYATLIGIVSNGTYGPNTWGRQSFSIPSGTWSRPSYWDSNYKKFLYLSAPDHFEILITNTGSVDAKFILRAFNTSTFGTPRPTAPSWTTAGTGTQFQIDILAKNTKSQTNLIWQQGTDKSTPVDQLKYQVYGSTSREVNMYTQCGCEKGAMVIQEWSTQPATKDFFGNMKIEDTVQTGHLPNGDHWAGVLVRNNAGGIDAYYSATGDLALKFTVDTCKAACIAKIVVGVTVPVVVIAGAVAFYFFYWRKRQAYKSLRSETQHLQGN